MSPTEQGSRLERNLFGENTAGNDSTEFVVFDREEEKNTTKKQSGRFALIRATASADSIELEPIEDPYYGNTDESLETDNDDTKSDRSRGKQRPWERDINTLSPQTWQRRPSEGADVVVDSKRESMSTEVTTLRDNTTRDDYAEEKKTTQGDEAPGGALSPNSLLRLAADSIHAVDYKQAVRDIANKGSMSYDDDGSKGTDGNIPSVLPPEFAQTLSRGVIHEATQDVNSDVVFGEPMTYGNAGDDAGHDAPAVADRAKAIEDWSGGKINAYVNEIERNRYFFPESAESGSQDIFEEGGDAFGFDSTADIGASEQVDDRKGVKGASAVLRFWSSTKSQDELDQVDSWKDKDPELDEYSTVIQNDPPVATSSRLMSSMKIAEQDASPNRASVRRSGSADDFDPGALKPSNQSQVGPEVKDTAQEIDPFSFEAFAALSSTTPKKKKTTTAFDPFGDVSGDFNDPHGLFAPSSASDLSLKKGLPKISSSKKDTKPTYEQMVARKRNSPTKATQSRTALSPTTSPSRSRYGTPPRSPPRKPLNVMQEEMNSLAPSRDMQDAMVLNSTSADSSEVYIEESGPPPLSPVDEFRSYPGAAAAAAPIDGRVLNDSVFADAEGEGLLLNETIWSFEQGLSSYEQHDRYDADADTTFGISTATLDDSHSHPCEI